MSGLRWNFCIDRIGDTIALKAIPNTDVIAEYMSQASQELTKLITKNEEKLLLRAMHTDTLKKLYELIVDELDRRK
jgi:hypothetical protein